MADYTDDEFVYVNPLKRTIVGRVEWLPSGKAKPLEMPVDVEEEETSDKQKEPKKHPTHRRKKRTYPWCSYRTARHVYNVAGKEKEPERHRDLSEALQRSLQQPYWDD